MKTLFTTTKSGIFMALIMSFFLMQSLSVTASYKIIYVNQNAYGQNNGTSWSDGYSSLQMALDNALSGDTILVSAGYYYPSKDKNGSSNPTDGRDLTFFIPNGVTLFGGFISYPQYYYGSLWETRNMFDNPTVLSGNIGSMSDTDNCYNVVQMGDSTILNGFQIKDGYANGNTSNYTNMGGGVHIYQRNLVKISHCFFENNYGEQAGGIAVYFTYGSSITIKRCVFMNDSASFGGGAIGSWNSAPQISNCGFIDNRVNRFASAIYNWGGGSTSNIVNCDFIGNRSYHSTDNGVIHSRGVTSTVANSIFWGNIGNDIDGSNGGTSNVSYSDISQSGYAGTNGNIAADPQFVDLFNNDFRLKISSPCIDAANGSVAPTTDFEKNARVDIPNVNNGGIGSPSYVDMGMSEHIQDVGVIDYAGNTELCGISSSLVVTIRVSNFSDDTLYNVPVNYIYNGGSVVSGLVPVILPNKDTLYSFSTTVDGSLGGTNILLTYTTLSSDVNTDNDTIIIKWVVTPNIVSFPFYEDFESGTNTYFAYNMNINKDLFVGVKSGIGKNDSKGLEIHGSETYSNPWNYPQNVTSAYQNYSYRTDLFNCSVDGTSQSNLALSFDFKQHKSWNQYNCVFRVMVNDSIYVSTFDGDSVFVLDPNTTEEGYGSLMFDLSSFSGSVFKLSFQAITYVYQPGFDEDFVRIDNIRLWNRSSIDVGVTGIFSASDESSSSNCGAVLDSLYLQVKNFGTTTASNIPLSGTITAPDGTHSYNAIMQGSLAPLQDTFVYIGTLNTTQYGEMDIRLATALSGDILVFNDSISSVIYNDKNDVPFIDDLNSIDPEWNRNGFFLSKANQTSNKSQAFMADVYQGYYGDLSIFAYDPFGVITDKSILVFDYFLSGNLGQDTLGVLVSEDCGNTWNQVLTLGSSTLPLSSKYSRITTGLSSYINKNIFIKFKLYGQHSNGYQLFIDNVGVINQISFDLGNDTTICANDSLVLSTGYGQSGYSHEWTLNGGTNILSTDSTLVVNQTGTYTAVVTDSFGSSFSNSINITVLPKPQAQFATPDVTICQGNTAAMGIVFNGQSPWIYTLKENQISHVDTSVNQYYSKTKIYSSTTQLKIITLTDNYGCVFDEVFDSMTITVNPLPTVSITGLSSTYCSNDAAVTVNTSPSGGILSGMGISGTVFNPKFASPGLGSIIYSYTDNNGCLNTDTVSVTVNSSPNVHFTSNLNSSYCHDGDTVHLSALPTGGTFSGSGVNSGIFDPSQATAGTVDITYSYTDGNGCGGVDSLQTIVHILPIVTLSSLGSTCANSSPITLSGGSPSGGTFSGPGVAQGVFYPAIAPLGSDTIIYSYVDVNGCINSAEQAINVNSVPIASFTMPSTVCVGDSVAINYTGTAIATTSWDFDGGVVSSGAGQGPYGVSWASSGVKAVGLSVSDGGCTSDTTLKLINVLSSFAQITAVGNTTVCYGDSVVLFANTGIGYSYQWFDTAGILSNDTLSYYIASQSGTYYAEVTNENNCPAISNSVAVVVQSIVTADFTLPATACKGDMVNITYTGNSGASGVYNWSFDGGVIASGSGQGPYSVIWNTDSIKMVSLSVVENGCSSMPMDKSISILSTNAQITALGSTNFCDGDSIVIYANAGPYSYNWKRNGVSLGINTPLYTASTAGNYSVVVTNTSTGCSDESDSLYITVNTADFGLAFTANPTSFTIPPFNTQITNQTAATGDYYWQWDLGDGNTSTVVSPNHQYMFDGTYTVSVFAQNINTGCRDTLVKTDYITCTGGSANPCSLVASITPSGAATICPGDSILLKATYNQGANYQWLKDGVLISGATDSSYYATMQGMYQIMVSDATCSQFSQAFALSNYTVINPTIVANGSIMPCTNDSMQLQVTTYFNSYLWSNGATTQSIYVKTSGNYQVTITDANGCQTGSQPYVVNASLLQTPEICIVGVDSATNHNVIVWERQANVLVDSFRVYRESVVAGVYDLIGSRSVNSPGLLMDAASNPLQRAYRYKITAVDTCGQETPPSSYHQTIHLNINAGLNNSWNLIWEGYHGFNFGSYRIYRGSDSANMVLLTQIQSTLNSYTDLNPPAGKVYYQIEVESPHPCYPDSIYSKAKTNYNTSRSNRVNTNMAPNTGMGMQVQNDLLLNIYPNPNKGMFTLEIMHPGKVAGRLTIINNIGEIVYSQSVNFNGRLQQNIDLHQLSKGIYFVRIQTNDELITSKVVIQ